MRVLLTGATGFLGSYIAEDLRGRGLAVRALVRSTRQTQRLERMGVDLVRGALDNVESLVHALDGVDAVVHCAGGGRVLTIEELYAQNAGTTLHLTNAMRRTQRKYHRFVFVSTLAAHGPARDGVARRPDDPAQPVSEYGKSKLAAEQTVHGIEDISPITIIRPPMIYGPRDDRMLSLFKAVRVGVLPMVSRGLHSIIHVRDCARAIGLAVTEQHASGLALFTDDGTPRAWEDICNAVAHTMGVNHTLKIRVPTLMLDAVGTMGEWVAKARGTPSFFTRDKARDAKAMHWVCNSELTRTTLGWKPEIELMQGLAQTADWYREAGWL